MKQGAAEASRFHIAYRIAGDKPRQILIPEERGWWPPPMWISGQVEWVDLSALEHAPPTADAIWIQGHERQRAPLNRLDLTPLSGNGGGRLESLAITHCSLQELDLSPLQHCPSLRSLSLSYNRFRELDLTPLQHCRSLHSLYLHGNRFREVDLSFIQHLPSFRIINASSNQLAHIDLAPLQRCKSLEGFALSGNPLEALDLSPLRHHPTLILISLQGPMPELDVSPLLTIKTDYVPKEEPLNDDEYDEDRWFILNVDEDTVLSAHSSLKEATKNFHIQTHQVSPWRACDSLTRIQWYD